jgi:crotonobetainyl-CoA:carnitine CoA-transferase CaiB-like acyl-CoA transferase
MDGAARAALADLLGQAARDEEGWAERVDDFDKLISTWAAGQSVAEAVEALRGAGLAAARVTPAAALLCDPQLRARGFWETVDHPVAGSFLCTGMPFAFLGRPRRWIRRVPPLYGQHTEEVLTEVLGRGADDLAALRQSGTISDRPAGL